MLFRSKFLHYDFGDRENPAGVLIIDYVVTSAFAVPGFPPAAGHELGAEPAEHERRKFYALHLLADEFRKNLVVSVQYVYRAETGLDVLLLHLIVVAMAADATAVQFVGPAVKNLLSAFQTESFLLVFSHCI